MLINGGVVVCTMLQFCNECYLFFNSLIIREKYFTEIY